MIWKGVGMGEPRVVDVRKVKLGPLKCYLEAKEFLGDQYWLFFGMCFVSMMVAGFVPILLIGPAYAGIAICFLAKANNERVVFDHVFKGFDYFGPTLIASLIYVGGTMVLFIPFFVALVGAIIMMSMQEPQLVLPAIAIFFLGSIYWLVVVSIATIVFFFGIVLIVDKKMAPWPAMQLATQGVFKNLMGVLGTASVGQLIYLLGVMMCFIPGILAVPLIFGGHFIAYWKIYGVEASQVVSKPFNAGTGTPNY